MLILVCLLDNLNWYVQLSMYLHIMLPSCLTYSYFHEYDVLALFLWEEFDCPVSLAHALPLYDIQPNPGLNRAGAPCKFWCDLNLGLSRAARTL